MKTKCLSFLLWSLFHWYQLKSKILTVVGDIRFSVWPMWLLYVPEDYYVKGNDIQEIQRNARPGDILLRGYSKRWLDGLFIPTAHGYSHAGVYVGRGQVIHAVAQGVSKVHLIDFCQADRVALFRQKDRTAAALAVQRAKSFIGSPYDFSFKTGQESLYCFQLAAQCYKELKLEQHQLSLLCFKLPKWVGTCYLDKSFFETDKLQKVIEVGK